MQDISLVRADSLDSLSSGGDSDGGPAEPTAAEISLLSASIGKFRTLYIYIIGGGGAGRAYAPQILAEQLTL